MSLIAPHLRLYNYNQPNQVRLPIKEDKSTIQMISMITFTTTREQFDKAWQENPDYRLENVGPNCMNDTSIHVALERNNPSLGEYLIKQLNPKYINASNAGPSLFNILVLNRYTHVNDRNDSNLEFIRQLAVLGANVNLPYPLKEEDGFNTNPLSLALKMADVKLTKILLQYGAEKYWAFNPDKTALIEQKFTKKENKVFDLAKKEIMDSNLLFIFASNLKKSSLGFLPKKVVAHILTCDRVIGSNHHLVKKAQEDLMINL